MTVSTVRTVRAPQLRGRAGCNTGCETLSLAHVRSKIVLLDFWTFCCVSFLHVRDELRPPQAEFGDALATIGVPSPKFTHEADPAALADAVARWGNRAAPDRLSGQGFADGAVRRYQAATGEVSTLATGVVEPSDVLLFGGMDTQLG
ncbi:MAG: hypothetical protein ACRDRL_04435 [Sciscionella sp.]